jgi:prophage antirepressor-like protein
MDITQLFPNANVTINIKGTLDDPLFQANQIGKLLGFTNIRKSVVDFDNDEKVVMSSSTPGGQQQVVFLTEIGLYRLLGQSRLPIARSFQKWVAKVVKEIRQTGKYEIENS